MSKLVTLVFIFSINILIQHSQCKREKPSTFTIPGINVKLSRNSIKNYLYGISTKKDEIILDKQLEHIEPTREILCVSQDIAITAEKIPNLRYLSEALQRLIQLLNAIDDAFRQYENMENLKRNASDYEVYLFAKNANSRYSGPLANILEIYSITLPSDSQTRSRHQALTSIVSALLNNMKGYEVMCGKDKSQQLMFQPILDGITIAELKVYLIVEFSIRKLAELREMNYKNEIKKVKNELQKRFKKLTTNFQRYMRKASREVWQCDPHSYIEDETYFKINLFQLNVARDHELTGDVDCHYDCDYFNDVVHYRCENLHDYYDYRVKYYEQNSCKSVRMCAGRLYDCKDRFSDYNEVWTCPAKKNSTRGYEFIEEGKFKNQYGASTKDMPTCKQKYTYDYRSWDRKLRNCDICLCPCDDRQPPIYADAKINLRPVTADKNYLITGIRWIKKNHTFHLQIEQGKVLARGKVDYASVQWKDIQEPRDANDVAHLRWNSLRGFLLHDTEQFEDKVIAGIKFEVVENKNIKLLSLRSLLLPYEYESGRLHYSTNFYEDQGNSVAQGLWNNPVKLPEQFSANDAVNIGSTELPTSTKEPSTPLHESKKYVLLTTSDLQTDKGQYTVPFFDMQENVGNPPVPLAGVGIYIKKTYGYGGFLALKLLTFDYTCYIAK